MTQLKDPGHAPAPAVNRSVKLPRKKLRVAIREALGIDITEQTLRCYQINGRMAFSMILGCMASSVDDYEAMVNADTVAERQRRGIAPPFRRRQAARRRGTAEFQRRRRRSE